MFIIKKSLRAVLQLDDSDDEQIYETEINVLKGNILSQLGKMKMVDGNFYEAEDLYQESLKCFGNLIGNQFMKANIEYNLGILRFQQGDYDNSEVFLRESMSIREKQCGRCNILISDNLIALARLLSTITNLDGYDRQEAECLYRRALAIREKCLGGEGLLVAEVLFELGELVGEDTSYQAKIEATSLLSRALDIKTKNLGGDHQDTKVIQSLLTSVEVSIKLGQYQFGPAKPTDKRSKNYPYSNLSFRDKDLKDLSLKEIDRRNQNRLFMTRSHSWDSLYRNATPYSAISFISASEKVLLENQRPYLVKREIHTRSKSQSVPPILKSRELPSPVTCLTTLARRQLNAEINLQDIMEKELKATGAGNIGPDTVVDNYASRVNSPPSSPQPPEVKIFRVTRPFSAPITLSNRYNTLNHKLLNNRYSLKKNRPISSALSTKSVPLQPISGESYHASHCLIPGPHSIHISNTTSVLGPNSSIDTLLGPPVAPRDVARQIHHKSAWYHVHGRYSTPEKEYPAKRSQTRPGSAFSMITTSNHGKLHSREFNHNQRSQSAQEILYDVDEYNNVVTKPASFKEAMTVGKIDICS